MTYIKSIHWLDKEALEAEVIISDGYNELLCFSHPFTREVNEELQEPIRCLAAENIVRTKENSPLVVKKQGHFEYYVRGVLQSKHRKIVTVGTIQIDLENEYIPPDIEAGSFVEFEVSRFDLYGC